MRIAIIGSGYVGLVSGACFADFGHFVTCVDNDPTKIEMLRRGEMPIFEPGLADLVASNVRSGRLAFSPDLASAVSRAEVVLIAVGTPSRRGDGHADLSYVYAAPREIPAAVAGPTVVVTKSPVPVGPPHDAAPRSFSAPFPVRPALHRRHSPGRRLGRAVAKQVSP